MPRFSLRWLLTAMAFSGLVIAVLHRPEAYLRGTLALAVWASLLSAVAVLVLFGVRSRPFAFGFLLFGFAFLVTTTLPENWNLLGDVKSFVAGIALPVHELVVQSLANRLAVEGQAAIPQGYTFVLPGRGTYDRYQELSLTESTIRMTLTMLISCLGGCIASALKNSKDGVVRADVPRS